MEIWKNIIGFECYQCSNSGNVRSIKNGKIRILKPSVNSNQKEKYFQVKFCVNGKVTGHKVHKLVFETFNGNDRPSGTVIHHKNLNSLDNRLENLVLISHRENCSIERTQKSKLPTGVSKTKNGMFWAKIWQDGRQISLGTYKTIEEAEKAYNNKRKHTI